MCVDRHGRLAKGGIEHHVGGLAADAGQRLERFAGLRNIAGMPFDQQSTGFNDILRLAVVQADGLDELAQSVHAQCMYRLRGIGNRKQAGSGLVDAYIGRLRRQYDRNQQFERVAIVEFRGRVGVVVA